MPLISSKQVPAGLPEVSLPPNVVQRNHGKDMADIIASLAMSRAGEARSMTYDKFKWSLAYIQGTDPDHNDTRDPTDFAMLLAKSSKVYLIARGARFKGCAILDETPPQIMARFEERARLICGGGSVAPDSDARPLLAVFDEWVDSNRHADPTLVQVVRYGLERLVCGAER